MRLELGCSMRSDSTLPPDQDRHPVSKVDIAENWTHLNARLSRVCKSNSDA